jgi:hypothetical protein
LRLSSATKRCENAPRVELVRIPAQHALAQLFQPRLILGRALDRLLLLGPGLRAAGISVGLRQLNTAAGDGRLPRRGLALQPLLFFDFGRLALELPDFQR